MKFPHIKTPAVKNAPRPIFRQRDNGPATMKLDESATSDGPQETGTATMHQRTMEVASNSCGRLGGRGTRSAISAELTAPLTDEIETMRSLGALDPG
jgi:hypothetical protein